MSDLKVAVSKRIELTEKQLKPAKKQSKEMTTWERERDRLKTLLVIVVVIFWLSVAFQLVMYFVQDGSVNFILLSIISGMMVLGTVLKARYQRHLSKKTQE